MKNSDVIKAWYYGKKGISKSLLSDGKDLWSFALRIGITGETGDKICLDHRITGTSKTTANHIALCSKVANMTVNPNGENTSDSFFQTTIFV